MLAELATDIVHLSSLMIRCFVRPPSRTGMSRSILKFARQASLVGQARDGPGVGDVLGLMRNQRRPPDWQLLAGL